MYYAGRDNATCNYTNYDRLHIVDKNNVSCDDKRLCLEILLIPEDNSELIQRRFSCFSVFILFCNDTSYILSSEYL